MNFKLVIFLFACGPCTVMSRRSADPPDWPWHPGIFEMYWNIPTQICKYVGVDRFRYGPWIMGFRQNTNDTFFGDEINLLYSPGLFPYVKLPDELINGGIPQAADLDEHLDLFEKDVNRAIEDVDFEGPAIISFHHWRFVWILNGWAPRSAYRTLSYEFEKQKYPDLNDTKKLWFQAEASFEWKARNFTLETMKRAIKLRPKALWGWDAIPVCFNILRKFANGSYECIEAAKKANEQMREQLTITKAIYPAAYLHNYVEFLNGDRFKVNAREVILARVREALPYGWHTNHTYLYVRVRYSDDGRFLTEGDMVDSLLIPCELGMRGVILWDSSSDLRSPWQCYRMYGYMTTILRQAVLAVRSCNDRRLKGKYPRKKV